MQLREKVEQGEVIKILPSSNEAKVRIKRHAQCVGCSQRSMCDPFGNEYMVVTAKNNINAKIGDKVEIRFSLIKKSRAITILYIVPLVMFILGATIGSLLDPLSSKDLSSSGMGILFLILSFVGIYVYNKVLVKDTPALFPFIVRKIQK